MSATGFRARLRQRDRLIGTFVKTASHQVVEVLGRSGLDVLVADAEHAPFDRRDLDVAALAAQAVACPLLVRVPNPRPDTVLGVLDLGVTGVLAPHMRGAAEVQALLSACRYRDGTRGFSNSSRAGGYGDRPMAELAAAADREVAVLCQVEDREAVDRIEEIAALDGVDCLFIGRADLTMSYGAGSLSDPVVESAVERVCSAAMAAGRPLGVFLPDLRELARFEALGVTFFIIGSDQSMLRAQAAQLATSFRR